MAAGKSWRIVAEIGLPASRLSISTISSACCLNRSAHLQQDMAALGGAHGAPGTFEGAAGGGNGMINVRLVAFGNGGDDLFGRGIEGFERPARAGGHAAAVDQEMLRLRQEFGRRRLRRHSHMQQTSYFLRSLYCKVGGIGRSKYDIVCRWLAYI